MVVPRVFNRVVMPVIRGCFRGVPGVFLGRSGGVPGVFGGFSVFWGMELLPRDPFPGYFFMGTNLTDRNVSY